MWHRSGLWAVGVCPCAFGCRRACRWWSCGLLLAGRCRTVARCRGSATKLNPIGIGVQWHGRCWVCCCCYGCCSGWGRSGVLTCLDVTLCIDLVNSALDTLILLVFSFTRRSRIFDGHRLCSSSCGHAGHGSLLLHHCAVLRHLVECTRNGNAMPILEWENLSLIHI